MGKYLHFVVLIGLVFGCAPQAVIGQTLVNDTVWKGLVEVEEDICIPKGITLTIAAGTVVKVLPSESTRIDPEYLSHQTEILVRGALRVEGTEVEPVRFTFAGDPMVDRWAGIIIDGGRANITQAVIVDAEVGVHVLDGEAQVLRSTVSKNRYGLIAQGGNSSIVLQNSTVSKNEYGVLTYNGGTVSNAQAQSVDNEKHNLFSMAAQPVHLTPLVYTVAEQVLTQVYTNETLTGNTIWRGRIRVQGQVRVPPEGRLVIMPGTIVEFTFRDTNDDGIGENGILVQGGLVAKGTPEKQILFRSAEAEPKKGDWDSINVLGSDQTKNLIEFCQIEDGYRGLHFHFANVSVTNSVLRNNYRGMQFQESLVEVRDTHFYANKSAVQARDSEVVFRHNSIYGNVNGANLFRMNVGVESNLFANNQWDGLRIREGAATVEHNLMVANRYGLLVADTVFGKFSRNLMGGNLEFGLALRNTDSVETRHNAMIGNGLGGIIVRDSRGEIIGNLITANGERGIGILSFDGVVQGNNITGNGLYGIGLDGPGSLNAAGNWWGDSDLKKEIFDQDDDPQLGKVLLEPVLEKPIDFEWPVDLVPIDSLWYGSVQVTKQLTVAQGAALTVMPGTVVAFADGMGMNVYGKIQGKGRADSRIRFTSIAQKGMKDWGEIDLEYAVGSFFVNCDFTNALWGIHSHYTNLVVDHCLFTNNDGGMRFRSGPMEVKNSIFMKNRLGLRAFRATATLTHNVFTQNEIGIYVRKEGGSLTITQNNIYNNERYSMRLGDFNEQDVIARDNWWGGVPVLDTLFDGNREAYIGKVIYEPVLDHAITLDWAVDK